MRKLPVDFAEKGAQFWAFPGGNFTLILSLKNTTQFVSFLNRAQTKTLEFVSFLSRAQKKNITNDDCFFLMPNFVVLYIRLLAKLSPKRIHFPRIKFINYNHRAPDHFSVRQRCSFNSLVFDIYYNEYQYDIFMKRELCKSIDQNK